MSSNNAPMLANSARTASEWVFVARSLGQLPGSEDQALECLRRAENQAQSVSDWIELASAWQMDLRDRDEAERCMNEAERGGGWSLSWESLVALARAWEQIFGDSKKSQHWMDRANAIESVNTDVQYWIENAKTWKNKLKDRATGIRYLESAETHAEDCRDWRHLAEIWKGSFRRRKDGLRCLKEAESRASKFYDWVELYRLWRETFQETNRGIECLEKAEALARQFSEWMRLVEISMGDFRDSIRGIRCLNVAETLAVASSDWVQLANSQMKTFGDRANAISSLHQAETIAITASDWAQIGYAWDGALGDPENCNRCLRIGYGKVNRFSMWESSRDTFTNWVVDPNAMSEGGVASLGVIEESCSFQGSWSDQIVSQRRPGCRARYYSFRVPETALVGIDVTPRDDTYLYLMSGSDAKSPVLEENDGPLWGGSNARIVQILQAGVYSIEATTCSESGPEAFMLTIRYRRDPYTYLAELQE